MTSNALIAATSNVRAVAPRAALTTLALILSLTLTANPPEAQANASSLTPDHPEANQPDAPARASSHTPNQPEAQARASSRTSNQPDAPARATSLTSNQPDAPARATPDPAPRAATAGYIHPPGLPCGYTVEVIERPECPEPYTPPLIYVQGLNKHGTVVGYRKHCDIDQPGRNVAWIWQPGDGVPTDLTLPDEVYSAEAYDINDHGVIAGLFRREAEPWRGFVYDTNTGEWTELEPVDTSGSGTASANAINNAGVVAGTRSIGESHQPYNAFTWSADDGYTDLGVIQGPSSWASDISDSGWVGGATGTPFQDDRRGLAQNGGSQHTMDPLPGGVNSVVNTINDHGVAAGGAVTDQKLVPDHFSIPGRWTEGVWEVLPIYDECWSSVAFSIRNDGIVVGRCATDQFVDVYPLMWIGTTMYDISGFIEDPTGKSQVEELREINESGQLLAKGTSGSSGGTVGFLLTPIETPPGDLNGDCEVGPDDLGLLLSEWGHRESPADLTGDGIVGGADLGVLLSNWTK